MTMTTADGRQEHHNMAGPPPVRCVAVVPEGAARCTLDDDHVGVGGYPWHVAVEHHPEVLSGNGHLWCTVFATIYRWKEGCDAASVETQR